LSEPTRQEKRIVRKSNAKILIAAKKSASGGPQTLSRPAYTVKVIKVVATMPPRKIAVMLCFDVFTSGLFTVAWTHRTAMQRQTPMSTRGKELEPVHSVH
jgi:hypothetical protein